jgi:ubiquinone/menaquinone biosynthesis C-methylase UbiE
MPHGTHGNEIAYYNSHFFSRAELPVKKLDLSLIQARKVQCIFERHHYYPADLFFFSIDGVNYFGRKTISPIYIAGKQQYKKCNQLAAHMIIGLSLRTQTTDKGQVIFYKPLNKGEKVFLFNYLKNNLDIDIYFPYPVLKNGREDVQSIDAWDTSDELAEDLNTGEDHIRQYTLDFLSQFNLNGARIYDPACSTGKFIDSIKKTYPEAYLIGQDINPTMIAHAKKHSLANELHVGNALYPCVPKESVDFMFLRFLNLSVLSSENALKLFCKLANCCKNNGTIVVFGFTPVLLSAELFSMLELDVKQTIAYNESTNTLFQYYVLKKTQPVPMLRYEHFSALTLSKKQIANMIDADKKEDTIQSSPLRARL